MRCQSKLLLLCVLLANSCLASEKVADTSFDAYYDGKRYQYVISHQLVERAPHWDPIKSPNPPISAAIALEKGNACIHDVPLKTDAAWELRELALGQAAGGWIWVARYRLVSKGQPMTGYWPTLFCPILMDGTVIKPIVTESGQGSPRTGAGEG